MVELGLRIERHVGTHSWGLMQLGILFGGGSPVVIGPLKVLGVGEIAGKRKKAKVRIRGNGLLL